MSASTRFTINPEGSFGSLFYLKTIVMKHSLCTNQALFDFHDHQVRTHKDDRGNPWFVASDVCSALEIRNSRDALSKLDDDEKDVVSTDTLRGRQSLAIINESGLYELIFRSRKAEAKTFKRWVKNEVLPALRRDGVYIVGEEKLSYDGMMSYQIQKHVDDLTAKLAQAVEAKMQRRRQEHEEEKLARSEAFRYLRRGR